MAKKASSAVLEMMREDVKRPPPANVVAKISAKIRELRSTEKEREDYNALVAEKGSRIREIKVKELPDLFDQAKIDNLGIPEEGNLPAYNIEVGTIYKANIGSATEPRVDDFVKSLEYIQKQEPNLVKTTYTIEFGMKEDKERKAFEALLKEKKIQYSSSFGVPWNSLTAWFKNRVEVEKKPVNIKLIGGTIERIAQVIKPKATRAKKAAQDAKATPKAKGRK